VTVDGTLVGVVQDGHLRLIDASSGTRLRTIEADPDVPDCKIARFHFTRQNRIVYTASGPEDRAGGFDLGAMLPWSVVNEIPYIVGLDGSGRRRLGDRHVGLEVVDVVER
jgi:hypothetical protein